MCHWMKQLIVWPHEVVHDDELFHTETSGFVFHFCSLWKNRQLLMNAKRRQTKAANTFSLFGIIEINYSISFRILIIDIFFCSSLSDPQLWWNLKWDLSEKMCFAYFGMDFIYQNVIRFIPHLRQTFLLSKDSLIW